MDDNLSEKEQIEQLRAWWSDYGSYVIIGVVLGGLVLFGWNYHQGQQRDAQLSASALYDELTNHVVDGDVEEAEAIVAELEAEYVDLAYTAQARLAMARLYMDKNRDQDAAEILRELMESDAGEQFRSVARLRLSKVLLYQGKAEEVVDLLSDNDGTSAFAARFSEALGDAYYDLGDFEAAREAYSLALIEPAQSATVDQQFVQLKLLDLPMPVDTAASDEVGEAEVGEAEVGEAEVGTDETAASDAGNAVEDAEPAAAEEPASEPESEEAAGEGADAASDEEVEGSE